MAEFVMSSLLHRLEKRVELTAADRHAVEGLPFQHRQVEPGSYMVREGERAGPGCGFLLAGLAFRHKLTAAGARQIVSLEMAGNFLDIQHLFLDVADHNVQSLTRLETAEIDRGALRTLALSRPAIGQALWVEAQVGASISREWVLNVGRRDARTRVAHLLCEFAVRCREAGTADGDGYALPMSQEQLGDATGLTSVHINRTMKGLDNDGLIRRDRRNVVILDWERLMDEGDFNARYLHFDQSRRGEESDRPA